MASAVVKVRGLVKDYGRFRALRGVDLEVQQGEVFGFIGPNGAGKSTTIRCILDLLRPTEGSVEVLGTSDLRGHPEVRARVGYLPGELAMHGSSTVREHLAYLCELRQGRGAERVEELAARFGLDLDRRFRGLSKGNKQKVGVVQAFMHTPDLLILDEPTSGLDPLLQQEFLRLAREAHVGGATLLVSSHILSEVEAIAGRVAIIRAGAIVDVEDVAKLRERAGQHVTLTFDEPPSLEAFSALPGLEQVSVEGHTLSAVLHGAPDALLKEASRHTVTRWTAHDRNLEELFMDHYRPDGAASDGDRA
ncbi:MAG: ABC transporter ATP-binding protein [Deltaproteobacteria bacterium]|nr:ABC transporter ATP-binding protein [Deltaproteobacteria bacterium]